MAQKTQYRLHVACWLDTDGREHPEYSDRACMSDYADKAGVPWSGFDTITAAEKAAERLMQVPDPDGVYPICIVVEDA